MNSKVRYLPLAEEPFVQGEAIQMLQEALGAETSRDVVELAVFEVSDRLCRLELAFYEGDLIEMRKIAQGLVGISSQIGLQSFSNTARNLADEIERSNFVNVAAITGRLLRLGERSLFCAVELADYPG